MADQKDATGTTTVATSFDEAVRQTAARRVALSGTGFPTPDTPTGAPHLNPALTPAPIRAEIPERIPVPVINDPGLVGANPDLSVLNQQYRKDIMGHLPDPTMGVTTENHQEAIAEAAKATQAKVVEKVDAAVTKAVDDTQKTAAAEKAVEKKAAAKAN